MSLRYGFGEKGLIIGFGMYKDLNQKLKENV
jgi:hypothetical protein